MAPIHSGRGGFGNRGFERSEVKIGERGTKGGGVEAAMDDGDAAGKVFDGDAAAEHAIDGLCDLAEADRIAGDGVQLAGDAALHAEQHDAREIANIDMVAALLAF